MNLGERNIRRRRQIIGAIFGFLALLFVVYFRWEIRDVLTLFWEFVKAILRRKAMRLPTDVELESLGKVAFTLLVGYVSLFYFWMTDISRQALLPAMNFREIYRTGFHFWLHTLGLHGPAVLIKDGKILQTKEDTRKGPGVVVVDFNSAVVLEDEVPPPGLQRVIDNMVHILLRTLGLADPIRTPQARGAGIVFIRRRERIRGAVDLRKQFRMQFKVTAYTRDGIEVFANVWSIFTIGSNPDPVGVQVCYDGEPRAENLRVVMLEELPTFNDPGEKKEKYFRVKNLSDDLDRADRAEIHRQARIAEEIEKHPTESNKWFRDYAPLPAAKELPEFDSERVFAAVFSEARSDRDRLPWTDLPARVAASYFREILSQVNYDELYGIGEDRVPLFSYKSRLRISMRNNGLLSFRFLYPKNGRSLKVGQIYSEKDLRITPVMRLKNSKVLRDRGIRVIASGFGDIMPVNEAIYNYRLENWRAPWQRDTEILNATKELEATRIRSRARAAAQRDLAAGFMHIFEQYENSEEILVLRLFQALESVAADPRTQRLLPQNTIDMMKTLQGWVLPPPQSPAAGTIALPPQGQME